MIVDLISIHKRNSLKVKIEIYYQTIKITTKNIFQSFFVYSSLTKNSVRKGSSRKPIDNVYK